MVPGTLAGLALSLALSSAAAAPSPDLWEPIGPAGVDVTSVALDPGNAAVSYLGSQEGVFKTVDGAQSWSAVNSGLADLHVMSIAIDPLSSATLYAATRAGLFRTTSGGAAWSLVGGGLPAAVVLAVVVAPSSPNVFYASLDAPFAGSNLFRSDDGGRSWRALETPLPNTGLGPLVVEPEDADALWAGSSQSIFRTTNGALSWRRLLDVDVYSVATALSVDPIDPRTVFVGSTLFGPQGSRFGSAWRSVDSGFHWDRVFAGTPVTSIVVDPMRRSTVFLSTADSYTGVLEVLRSDDGGASWKPVSEGLPRFGYGPLVFDIRGLPVLLLGTTDGIYRLTIPRITRIDPSPARAPRLVPPRR